MIEPTPEELALLTPTERVAFRIADLANRRLGGLAVAWNSTALVFITWLLVKRRIRTSGLEHLRRIDPRGGVLMVANHRSFFDFFAVCCVLFNDTAQPRRVLFPVRSSFFYDHWLGTVVNAAMSMMAMFPPILRDPKRRAWNAFAIARCTDELRERGVFLGVHPEGTRSQSPDPYTLGPARLGMGQVALDAHGAHILPIFIVGLSNSLMTELRRNWRSPADHPIDICFGPAVRVDDLRSDDPERARHARREAIDRCMRAIQTLADACRARHEAARGDPDTARSPGPGSAPNRAANGAPGSEPRDACGRAHGSVGAARDRDRT